MLVTIIIPVYNRLEITKVGIETLNKNLKSYLDQKGSEKIKFEVVVIDDGSTDGTSAWINEYSPEIHLLKGDGNLWWTGGVDMGARYAVNVLKTDFVLLWNDDVFCQDNYFSELTKRISDDLNRDTIYGSVIYEYPNMDKIWSKGGHFNRYWGILTMYNGTERDKKLKGLHWLTGMGTVIPSRILEALDFFDYNNFSHYFGDTDFTLRAYEHGFKIVSCPELKIWN